VRLKVEAKLTEYNSGKWRGKYRLPSDWLWRKVHTLVNAGFAGTDEEYDFASEQDVWNALHTNVRARAAQFIVGKTERITLEVEL